MIVCLPVTADGEMGQSWGRADRVAIAEVDESGISRWEEFEVGWDKTHDVGEHSEHHERIARFLTDHHVACVVAGHMGPPMVEMLGEMGIGMRLGAGARHVRPRCRPGFSGCRNRRAAGLLPTTPRSPEAQLVISASSPDAPTTGRPVTRC